MSDDWPFPTAFKAVPSVTSNRTSAVNPHLAPELYDSAKLIAEIARLRAQVAKLRGLLWYGWHEMNAIRARSGVPLDERGSKQSISEEYWDAVVEAMNEALGDDAKPWPSDDANAALKETER